MQAAFRVVWIRGVIMLQGVEGCPELCPGGGGAQSPELVTQLLEECGEAVYGTVGRGAVGQVVQDGKGLQRDQVAVGERARGGAGYGSGGG